MISLPLLLCAPALQQPPATARTIARAPQASTFAGTYHPLHGFRAAAASNDLTAHSPGLIYNNTVLTAYYSLPGQDQEWIDEGRASNTDGDLREQILGATITYCTSSSVPVEGVLRLYDETVICAGPSSWPTANCSYTLRDLPGSTSGGVDCYTVALDFAGLECDLSIATAQTRFGWSITWSDSLTAEQIAWGGAGNDNSFVWFDTTAPNRNAAFLGCYWFNGLPKADFALRLEGPPPDTYVDRASSPGAQDRLNLSLDHSLQSFTSVQFALTDLSNQQAVDGALWFSPNRVENHLAQSALALDAHELAQYATRFRPPNRLISQAGVFDLTVGSLPAGTVYSQAAQLDAQGKVLALSNALMHIVR